MAKRKTLGDLQSAIMRVIWQRGEASAAEVHAALLTERGLAPTTISTMLRRMEEKGVVVHRKDGRQFLYRPAVSLQEVRRSMVGELVDRLFAGDPGQLVSHLLSQHEVTRAEVAELKALLDELERKGGR
jgi:BlaI family penicillinase repressor